MPRNKRHIDRKEKQQAILEAASTLFTQQGFEGTSMTQLAKASGVAANTIYWYFENKDDVLIAVLNQALEQGLQSAAAMNDLPLHEKAVKVMSLFDDYGDLVSTVHNRLHHSEAVKDWHMRFHQVLQSMVASELIRHGTAAESAIMDAQMLIYVMEGLDAHPHHPEEREDILRHALYRVGVDTQGN